MFTVTETVNEPKITTNARAENNLKRNIPNKDSKILKRFPEAKSYRVTDNKKGCKQVDLCALELQFINHRLNTYHFQGQPIWFVQNRLHMAP